VGGCDDKGLKMADWLQLKFDATGRGGKKKNKIGWMEITVPLNRREQGERRNKEWPEGKRGPIQNPNPYYP